jgi:hypothetical protein
MQAGGSGPWACAQCTFLNQPLYIVCAVCGGPSDIPKEQATSGLACSKCTHINERLSAACTCCGYRFFEEETNQYAQVQTSSTQCTVTGGGVQFQSSKPQRSTSNGGVDLSITSGQNQPGIALISANHKVARGREVEASPKKGADSFQAPLKSHVDFSLEKRRKLSAKTELSHPAPNFNGGSKDDSSSLTTNTARCSVNAFHTLMSRTQSHSAAASSGGGGGNQTPGGFRPYPSPLSQLRSDTRVLLSVVHGCSK